MRSCSTSSTSPLDAAGSRRLQRRSCRRYRTSSAWIPIAGIAGDQQAALFGQTCLRPGMAKNTYGTGCFMLMNTGATPVRSPHRLLTTVAWRMAGQTNYALEGSIFIGGAAVQWLRDGLGIINSAPEVEALAATVPDSGGVNFVPAFTGLGAPHWDPYARGAIVGLTRGATALTSPAPPSKASPSGRRHRSSHGANVEDADGLRVHELRVDGGASTNDLLMQIRPTS